MCVIPFFKELGAKKSVLDPTCHHLLTVSNNILGLIQVLNLIQFMLQSSQ